MVSVLQSELNRYENDGHSVGELGSVYIKYHGSLANEVGEESPVAGAPHNHSIIGDPSAAVLCSDNFDTLLKFYANLTTEHEKTVVIKTLLDRINENKGYLTIAYFIVCALWRLGDLREALRKAKKALPVNDTNDFGLYNVLKLLSRLLRYCHSEFTTEMLDEIEAFISGIDEQPLGMIEKIAAVRVLRFGINHKMPEMHEI